MSKQEATEGQATTAEGTTDATTETAPKEPRRGIGTVVVEALRAGKTNEEALAAVKAEFPDANTTMASVNWYRNNLRGKGEDIPTARSLKSAGREQAAAEKKAAKEAEKAERKAKRDAEKAAAKKKKATTSADAEALEGTTAGAGEGDGGFLS